MIKVSNPTAQSKAVIAADGYTVILPGDSVDIDATWSDDDISRYGVAGLVIDVADPKGKPPKVATVTE